MAPPVQESNDPVASVESKQSAAVCEKFPTEAVTNNNGRSEDTAPDGRKHTWFRTAAAWSVHLFTASGAVCCLLAIEASYASQFRTSLLWLMVAVIIDAVDGTFARMVGVKVVLPNFDGTLLDNVIDYANYVIVPALIIHRAGILPDSVSFPSAATICLASAYQFCQRDAKTDDHYFKGFPSYWNVVALYLIAMRLDPMLNAMIIFGLIVLVFVPVKYIYVTRTVALRTLTLTLTAIWALLATVIVWQLPEPNEWLVWGSGLYVIYYAGASLLLTKETVDRSASA